MPDCGALCLESFDFRLLPDIAVIDVENSSTLRYAAWGSRLVYMFSQDMTGRPSAAMSLAKCRAHLDYFYFRIIGQGKPVYVDSVFCYPQSRIIRSEKTGLPFRGADGRISSILMLQTFDTSQGGQDRLIDVAAPSDLLHASDTVTADGSSPRLDGQVERQHLRF